MEMIQRAAGSIPLTGLPRLPLRTLKRFYYSIGLGIPPGWCNQSRPGTTIDYNLMVKEIEAKGKVIIIVFK